MAEDQPLTVVFDPTLPYTDRRQSGYLNMGCPPGYFAQMVSIDQENAQKVPGITDHMPSSGIRCRLLPESMASPEIAEIIAESDVSADEVLNVIAGAIEDTGKQLPKLAFGGGMMMVALVIGAVFLLGRR